MTDFRALCVELATLAKREHYYCEDSWYSCPKAEDKCANDSEGEDCNCGADIHNAKVEAIAVLAKYGTPTPTPPAALAEDPVGPTNEELRDFAAFDADFDCYETTDESGNVGNAWECSDSQLLDFARAVLARWGQP